MNEVVTSTAAALLYVKLSATGAEGIILSLTGTLVIDSGAPRGVLVNCTSADATVETVIALSTPSINFVAFALTSLSKVILIS